MTTSIEPRLPPSLAQALVRAAGPGCAVIGPSLRHLLLGRPVSVLQVAVVDDPERVARLLAVELAGAVTGTDEGTRVTLPTAVYGVRTVDLIPVHEPLADWLLTREFTVDAIAWRPADGAFVDPAGGLADLTARLVRLTRPERAEEQPLCALRAAALAVELDGRIVDESAAAMRQHAARIGTAPGSAQRDALIAVLDLHAAARALRLVDDLGALDPLLPELVPGKGCTQPREHYYDVFGHLIETVAVLDVLLGPEPADGPWRGRFRLLWRVLPDAAALRARYEREIAPGRTHRALLKLAGLLHDVSKPETRTVQPNGRVRFFGHEDLGAHRAAAIMTRLAFTANEIELVTRLVKNHLRPGQLAGPGAAPTSRALARFFRDLGEAAPDLLLLNLADHAAARGPALTERGWAEHVAYVAWVLANRPAPPAPPPRPLVTGHDLMAALNLPPGPLIGRLLHAIREAERHGLVRTREEALALARERMTAGSEVPAPASGRV
jgi:putative nucleotidyltransferase with HDIG domain